MTHLTLRQLQTAGRIPLLLDFRAGHCASLVPDAGNVYRDGAPGGALGVFRTGYGFETSHNGAATPLSQGYIQVNDNDVFFPPADGMCIIASYIQSSDAADCQIIGQGDGIAANTSWMLIRTSTYVEFRVADGADITQLTYNIASVPGQIETVTVRYTGGIIGDNCTISIVAPVPSSLDGPIKYVPQNVAQPVRVCCYSNSTQFPFHGTMRYTAFIRGGQTASILSKVQQEIEAFRYNTNISTNSDGYLVADRKTQYVSRFGVDRSVADEGGVIDNVRISNSDWYSRMIGQQNQSTFQIDTEHRGSNGALGSTYKGIYCTSCGGDPVEVIYMPRKECWKATSAEAAFGTWDFWWVSGAGDPSILDKIWVVASTPDELGNGYYVDVDWTTGVTRLVRMPGATVLATSAAGAVDDPTAWHRFRVTRTLAGVWNVYVNGVTLAGWTRIMGPVTDATHVVSDYVLASTQTDGAIGISNNEGNGVFTKWAGVVAPI